MQIKKNRLAAHRAKLYYASHKFVFFFVICKFVEYVKRQKLMECKTINRIQFRIFHGEIEWLSQSFAPVILLRRV